MLMNLKDLRYVDFSRFHLEELIKKDFGDRAFHPRQLSHFCYRPFEIKFIASTNF